MLAAVYASFSTMEKKKFHALLLHRRKAAQHAFRLLLSRNYRHGINLHHFRGLMRHVDASKCKKKNTKLFFYTRKILYQQFSYLAYKEIYLMFRLLNSSGTGVIHLHEFYQIYDVLDMHWRVKEEQPYWFSRVQSKPLAFVVQQVHRFVTWNIFDYFVCKLKEN